MSKAAPPTPPKSPVLASALPTFAAPAIAHGGPLIAPGASSPVLGQTDTLTAATPARGPPPGLPAPISAYNTNLASPINRWAVCGHISMARIYDKRLVCYHCRQPGSFGWLYQCTENREPKLLDCIWNGQQKHYDEIGELFSQKLQPPARGSEERSEKFGMLKSMTREQMNDYTPSQLSEILQAREHSQDTAILEQDRERFERVVFGDPSRSVSEKTSMMSSYNGLKPWVPSESEVCQFVACHRCCPNFGERTNVYLSIDGVLKNDISPAAAVGWGFTSTKQRPVTDVRILRNLGCRAVPRRQDEVSIYQENLRDYLLYHLDKSTLGHNPSGIPRSPAWNYAHELPTLTASTTTTGTAYEAVEYGPDLEVEETTKETQDETCEASLPSSVILNDSFLPDGEEMTLMEQTEEEEGIFGSEPLEVPQGIAVTEESVVSHIADIITRY